MTAALLKYQRHHLPNHSRKSRTDNDVFPVKNLACNDGDQVTAARKFFAAILWKAFPSPSEHDLAHKAAPVLGVSPRQVQNWLRCENSAAIQYVLAVMAIAGAEVVIRGRK